MPTAPRTAVAVASVALLSVGFAPAAASGLHERLEQCATIATDAARLQCYDGIVGAHPGPVPPSGAGPPVPPPEPPLSHGLGAPSRLAEHWELEPATRQGLFSIRLHRENYVLLTYSSNPNEAPYRPFASLVPGAGVVEPVELAFQLGFKLKLAEAPLGAPMDLWFGYTQRSHWQIANPEASNPFRATDYQPELMAVFPVDANVLGLRMRFLNLGIVHESNGQTATLSRSWNRVYVQAGFERGNVSVLARAWQRFRVWEVDENPDIVDYMGYGDVEVTLRRGQHDFSALARYNLRTSRGALQLGWAFPLTQKAPNLKGYLQFFSGYGYSLIDYNHRQNVLGIGLMIAQ
ncbi:MAG TPA: phospholipase A [Noviherbaspirillum sp.]|nr:phospholipase A [Noviherbaspirillum sp.]